MTARWIITGTPIDTTFPCLCRPTGKCSAKWCWCSGRLDVHLMPLTCCSRVNTPAVAAAAQRG